MKTFTNKKGISYLFVDTSEGDYDFKINYCGDRLLYQNDESEAPFPLSIRIEQGNYELIGLAKEVSEDIAMQIVDHGHSWSLYYHHSLLPYTRFSNAKECLSSVVQSLGLKNPVILKLIK